MWFAKVIVFSIATAGALVGIAYLVGKKSSEKTEDEENVYLWDEDDVPYDPDPWMDRYN